MQRRNVTCDPFLVYNPRMVDQNMPWSLKGISDEAREFAKMSADQSDVPVGAWLSQVIRTAAGTAGNAPDLAADPVPAPPLQQAAPPSAAAGGSAIERAAQIVDDFGFEPEGPARDADLIEDPAMLHAELLSLERRLENAETNTQDNLAPLLEEIERIRSRLAGSGNA